MPHEAITYRELVIHAITTVQSDLTLGAVTHMACEIIEDKGYGDDYVIRRISARLHGMYSMMTKSRAKKKATSIMARINLESRLRSLTA